MRSSWSRFLGLITLSLAAVSIPNQVAAHCDGMDGPVVMAAKKSLESRNVNYVLIWVQATDETAVKKAFDEALTQRKANPNSHEQSDLQFFETVVRLHRTGEGEEFTGLKPAGRDLGPIIPAADKAVETGSIDPLLRLLPAASHGKIRSLFGNVMNTKKYDPNDVTAGRRFVKAYVTFLHQAEAAGAGGNVHHEKPSHA